MVNVLLQQGDVLADHTDLLLHIRKNKDFDFIKMLTCNKIAGLAEELVHGVELLLLQSGFGEEFLLLVQILTLLQLILPVGQQELTECSRHIKRQTTLQKTLKELLGFVH